MDNYHEILGVTEDATVEDIKRAYRQKAREWHPDVNQDPSATEHMKEINAAYDSIKETHPAWDSPGESSVEEEEYGFEHEATPGMYSVEMLTQHEMEHDWDSEYNVNFRADRFQNGTKNISSRDDNPPRGLQDFSVVRDEPIPFVGFSENVIPGPEGNDVYEMVVKAYVANPLSQQFISFTDKTEGTWTWVEIDRDEIDLARDEEVTLFGHGREPAPDGKLYRATRVIDPYVEDDYIYVMRPVLKGDDTDSSEGRQLRLEQWLRNELPDLDYEFVVAGRQHDYQATRKNGTSVTSVEVYFPDPNDQEAVDEFAKRLTREQVRSGRGSGVTMRPDEVESYFDKEVTATVEQARRDHEQWKQSNEPREREQPEESDPRSVPIRMFEPIETVTKAEPPPPPTGQYTFFDDVGEVKNFRQRKGI